MRLLIYPLLLVATNAAARGSGRYYAHSTLEKILVLGFFLIVAVWGSVVFFRWAKGALKSLVDRVRSRLDA